MAVYVYIDIHVTIDIDVSIDVDVTVDARARRVVDRTRIRASWHREIYAGCNEEQGQEHDQSETISKRSPLG